MANEYSTCPENADEEAADFDECAGCDEEYPIADMEWQEGRRSYFDTPDGCYVCHDCLDNCIEPDEPDDYWP